MLTNMAPSPVFTSGLGRVFGLFLLLFVLSDQRRRTSGHTVEHPTTLDGSIDRDNEYTVDNQNSETGYQNGHTLGLPRDIQASADGTNVLYGRVKDPGAFLDRASTPSIQPGHYPTKHESVQGKVPHETGKSLSVIDDQRLFTKEQSLKERDTHSDYGFALVNSLPKHPVVSLEGILPPNKATRDGSSVERPVVSMSESIHGVLSSPVREGVVHRHTTYSDPLPLDRDGERHVEDLSPTGSITGIQSLTRYNLQEDGLTRHSDRTSTELAATLIEDTVMTLSHNFRLPSTMSPPLQSQWVREQTEPQIARSHGPLGNLLRGVPLFDAQQDIGNRKSSSVIDRRKIYAIPSQYSTQELYISGGGVAHPKPHSEKVGSFETQRLSGMSQVDVWGYNMPDDDKLNANVQQKRLRRGKRQIPLFDLQIKSEEEGSEPDEPMKVQSRDVPSTSDNISESGLSYRSKGQMAYIDTPRSRLKSSVDTRDSPSGSLALDLTDKLSNSNGTVDEKDIPNGISTESSEGVIQVSIVSESVNLSSSSEPESETEPEVEPESEAEPEAESEPEGEASDGTSEPETNAEGCNNRICYAEPYPDWEIAKPIYGGAWEFHVYAIGIAFGILAIYTFASMLVLRQKANLLSKGYFMSLNSLLLLMGTTRSIYLLVDGYDSMQIFPPVVSYILINISFPCLTSAFSILFLALLRATKMQIISRKIQKVGVLVGIIVFHFVLSITVDIIVGVTVDLRVLFLVCQVTFVVWGVFLFCGYFYLFWKLYHSPSVEYAARESTRQSNCAHGGQPGRDSAAEPKPGKMTKLKSFRTKVMLNLALKVTLSTAFLGVGYIVVVVYGMVDVFNVFASDPPEPWPFWAYHFCIRMIELSMCAAMSFVATQPLRYNRSSKSTGADSGCHYVLYFIPCYRSCVDGGDKHNSSGDKCITGVLSHTDSDGQDLNESVV